MINERLLLVIPPVIDIRDTTVLVDGDFANNLEAYLREFSQVCVMCPPTTTTNTFPTMVDRHRINGTDRLEIIALPLPYREDRYFSARSKVARLLETEIDKSNYVLVSPHSAFDWSTLAAKICRRKGKRYNMEADWNLPEARRDIWKQSPIGFNKFRKYIWGRIHDTEYFKALRGSSLSLLQGGDVFHDLGPYAQNAFCVLNVQVSDEDKIEDGDLQRKLDRSSRSHIPSIVYAGRAADIKGPFEWIDVITRLRDQGYHFSAIWAGDGELLDEMRELVRARELTPLCSLPGKLNRDETRSMVRAADVFLFCHKAKESPRCLVEALALGTPIVGFGTNYPRELVRARGGGAFVERGDVTGLSALMAKLLDDRSALSVLTAAAAISGRALDRNQAISYRIELMKRYLA